MKRLKKTKQSDSNIDLKVSSDPPPANENDDETPEIPELTLAQKMEMIESQ